MSESMPPPVCQVEGDEVWLPIPERDDGYQVSDLGRLRSVARTVMAKDGRSWEVPGRLRSTPIGAQGYPMVGLPDPTRRRHTITHYMHALVLVTFVGPRPAGMTETRHLNGDRTDNRLANLQYGTPLENTDDKRQHGTHHHTQKARCIWGHLLVAPNLRVAALPYRTCLACSRARATIQQAKRCGLQLDHQAVSDEKYAALMER